jgi:carbamoyl-phosphate synthase large subunit
VLVSILERSVPTRSRPRSGPDGLQLAVALDEAGVLQRLGIADRASIPAIRVAEDRLAFKETMARIGPQRPGGAAHGIEEEGPPDGGFPTIRPSFTGGSGHRLQPRGVLEIVHAAPDASPVQQVLKSRSWAGRGTR